MNSEWLLATIGVSPILEGNMPWVGTSLNARVANLPKKITDLIKGVLSEDHAGGSVPRLPRLNYTKKLDEYASGIQDVDNAAIIKKFADPSEAPEFIMQLKDAFDYLQKLFPVSEYNSFTGPKNLLPTQDKVFTFLNQLSVIDDITNVITLIGSAAILRSQVKTISALYPEISQYITREFYSCIESNVAAKKSYQVPPRTVRGLETWLGSPLHTQTKQAPESSTDGKAPAPLSVSKTANLIATPNQRATYST